MQTEPCISVLAYCNENIENSIEFFESIFSQSESNIELIISEALLSAVEKINNVKNVSIKGVPSSNTITSWYQAALNSASGAIVLFTSPKVIYFPNAFSFISTIYSNYPQCGTIVTQIASAFDGDSAIFDPYDFIPLLRNNRLPHLEQMFFARNQCAKNFVNWKVDEELLGWAYSWNMYEYPLIVASHKIGVSTNNKDNHETAQSIMADCKRRLEFQNCFAEQRLKNEKVNVFTPYAISEIYCHAAEKIEKFEGNSELFQSFVQRAIQSSKGTYRLEKLQAKLTGSNNEVKISQKPVDPNFNAKSWWDSRYASGGHSGSGSYDENYTFKRDYINALVRRLKINSIIDLGCGDGSQIRELDVESYHGTDVSSSVVGRCQKLYEHKLNFSFDVYDDIEFARYDLAMSLDVLYHVVEPDPYDLYLKNLISYSRYALIYANAIPRSDNTAHMLFRDHIKEIQSRYSVRIIEKVMNPAIPIVGFILFEIEK